MGTPKTRKKLRLGSIRSKSREGFWSSDHKGEDVLSTLDRIKGYLKNLPDDANTKVDVLSEIKSTEARMEKLSTSRKLRRSERDAGKGNFISAYCQIGYKNGDTDGEKKERLNMSGIELPPKYIEVNGSNFHHKDNEDQVHHQDNRDQSHHKDNGDKSHHQDNDDINEKNEFRSEFFINLEGEIDQTDLQPTFNFKTNELSSPELRLKSYSDALLLKLQALPNMKLDGNLEVSLVDLNSPDYSGWLLDQSDNNKKYCVVNDMLMCVFDNERASFASQVFMLPNYRVKEIVFKSTGFQSRGNAESNGKASRDNAESNGEVKNPFSRYQIELFNPYNELKHCFSAMNLKEHQIWMIILQKAGNLDMQIFGSLSEVSSTGTDCVRGKETPDSEFITGYSPSPRGSITRSERFNDSFDFDSSENSDGALFTKRNVLESTDSSDTETVNDSETDENRPYRIPSSLRRESYALATESGFNLSSPKSKKGLNFLFPNRRGSQKANRKKKVTLESLPTPSLATYLRVQRDKGKLIKCWCVLHSSILYLFKKKFSTELSKVAFSVRDAKVTALEKRNFRFEITPSDRYIKPVIVEALDRFDFNRWIKMLKLDCEADLIPAPDVALLMSSGNSGDARPRRSSVFKHAEITAEVRDGLESAPQNPEDSVCGSGPANGNSRRRSKIFTVGSPGESDSSDEEETVVKNWRGGAVTNLLDKFEDGTSFPRRVSVDMMRRSSSVDMTAFGRSRRSSSVDFSRRKSVFESINEVKTLPEKSKCSVAPIAEKDKQAYENMGYETEGPKRKRSAPAGAIRKHSLADLPRPSSPPPTELHHQGSVREYNPSSPNLKELAEISKSSTSVLGSSQTAGWIEFQQGSEEWARYYAILDDSCIYLYNAVEDFVAKEVIGLRNFNFFVKDTPETDNFSIQLSAQNGRQISVALADRESYDNWLDKLKRTGRKISKEEFAVDRDRKKSPKEKMDEIKQNQKKQLLDQMLQQKQELEKKQLQRSASKGQLVAQSSEDGSKRSSSTESAPEMDLLDEQALLRQMSQLKQRRVSTQIKVDQLQKQLQDQNKPNNKKITLKLIASQRSPPASSNLVPDKNNLESTLSELNEELENIEEEIQATSIESEKLANIKNIELKANSYSASTLPSRRSLRPTVSAPLEDPPRGERARSETVAPVTTAPKIRPRSATIEPQFNTIAGRGKKCVSTRPKSRINPATLADIEAFEELTRSVLSESPVGTPR